MEEFITNVIKLIVDNKEWLFSGLGLVVFTWIGCFFRRKRRAPLTQTILSGDGSSNFQVGGDVNVEMKKATKDVEEE